MKISLIMLVTIKLFSELWTSAAIVALIELHNNGIVWENNAESWIDDYT